MAAAEETEALPQKPVFALDASLTMNLGGDRQLALNTRMLRDDSEDEVQAQLDKLLRQGDRAKARYDLEELEAQFHVVGKTINDGIAAVPGIEFTLTTARQARQDQIKDVESKREAILSDAMSRHMAAGKTGDLKITGYAKQQIENCNRDIDKIKAEDELAVAQSLSERELVLGKIAHYQEDLKKRRTKINQLRALAGRDPITDYAEIEAAAIADL